MDLDAPKLVLQFAHLLAVCHHKGMPTTGFFHHLVDNQLRVASNVEAACAKLNSDTEAVDETFVLGGIV